MPAGRELDYFLAPRTSKLNYGGVYAALPNAPEIDARLGGGDTGWLFGRR